MVVYTLLSVRFVMRWKGEINYLFLNGIIYILNMQAEEG
jgi:hypothetical protein